MKKSIPLSVLGSCVLGFLVGRLTVPPPSPVGKPEAVPTGAMVRAPKEDPSPASRGERSPRPPADSSDATHDDPEFENKSRERNLADRAKFLTRCKRRFDSLIQDWTNEFHLTPAQVVSLESEKSESLSRIESGWGENGLDPSEELGDLVNGRELESKLDDLLDDTQRNGYEAWRDAREDQRRQSMAISALASIQLAVHMSSEQRQKVMDRLFDLSRGEDAGFAPPAPGQPDTSFMQELGTRLASGDDPAKTAAALARERIDKRCDALKDLLDASQLQDYREYLEELQQSWLSPEEPPDP